MAKYRHAKGPSALQVIIIVLVVLLSLAILAGGAFAVYHFGFGEANKPTEPTLAPTSKPTVATEPPTEPPTEDPQLRYTNMAKDYMSKMSDDEKIYQMLITTPEALTGVDVATMAGDATKEAVETHPVAGIIYDSQNFEDSQQTKDLISTTQSFAKTPMFIAVAEEGGDNAPVASKLGTAVFENMSTYADQGEQKALENASAIAKDISTFGFNLNFAPVANIEGDYAYATDAAVASPLVAQAIKGMQENDVISAIKRFPCAIDSEKTTDELRAGEFLPFSAGIQNDVSMIAISAAKLSSIDTENPAFLSKNVVTELLVKELKFNGVVVSPYLSDDLITSAYTTEQIVTGSVNAGINLFLAPADIEEFVATVKTALQNGTITQQQIDDSVTKILALKFKYGIIADPATAPTEASSQTATQVATEAATEAATQADTSATQ